VGPRSTSFVVSPPCLTSRASSLLVVAWLFADVPKVSFWAMVRSRSVRADPTDGRHRRIAKGPTVT
jgi:hypothetical protein